MEQSHDRVTRERTCQVIVFHKIKFTDLQCPQKAICKQNNFLLGFQGFFSLSIILRLSLLSSLLENHQLMIKADTALSLSHGRIFKILASEC